MSNNELDAFNEFGASLICIGGNYYLASLTEDIAYSTVVHLMSPQINYITYFHHF